LKHDLLSFFATPLRGHSQTGREKKRRYDMKRMAVLILLFMLVVPVLPVALAEDTANVDIGIGADTVNLNVTCTTSTSGTMHIFVNGVEVTETYVTEVYEHNYDGDIIYLNQKIDGVEYNLIALANYTDGKLSMLLVNDNCLAKWIGCLDSTSLVGQRIFNGNSTVVLELAHLTDNDNALLNMVVQLGNTIRKMDESHKAKLAELEDFLKSQAERISTLETELAPEFNVTNLRIEPKEVEPGKEVIISVKVTNTGELPGTYKVTSVNITKTGEQPGIYNMALGVKDGITTILEKKVTLEGGRSETLEFKVSPEVEGTYDVEVDGLKGSFTVKVSGLSPGYIAGILIIISAAIASVYAFYRRAGGAREHLGPAKAS